MKKVEERWGKVEANFKSNELEKKHVLKGLV